MIDRTSYEYKLLVRLYQLLERGKRLKDKEFILTVWPKTFVCHAIVHPVRKGCIYFFRDVRMRFFQKSQFWSATTVH